MGMGEIDKGLDTTKLPYLFRVKVSLLFFGKKSK
jgi:hypothetical protein